MDFDSIMLSVISQTEKDTHCNLKKPNSETEIRFLFVRDGVGAREMHKSGQKVITSSYNINKFWRCDVQHDDCGYNIVFLQVAKSGS